MEIGIQVTTEDLVRQRVRHAAALQPGRCARRWSAATSRSTKGPWAPDGPAATTSMADLWIV